MRNLLRMFRWFVADLLRLHRHIIRETGDVFCVPTNWIDFANRVFQTIRKHPDLTHFQDVFERDQYKQITEDIRRDFDQYLSPSVARFLIDNEKENSINRIKNSVQVEHERLLNTLKDQLRAHWANRQATANIRQRSLQFMQVQLTNILRSWEISAIMKSEQFKADQIVNIIDEQLRRKATSITHRNCLMDRQAAMEMFEKEFETLTVQVTPENFKPDSVWIRSIEMVSHLCDRLDPDALPSQDNLLAYLPFLKGLDPSSDSAISMHECLSKICIECMSRISDVEPLAAGSSDIFGTIAAKEIEQQYTFLNSKELSRIYVDVIIVAKPTRAALKQGTRQQYTKLFQDNWKMIVHVSKCFEILLGSMRRILSARNIDDPATEITLVQDALGEVKKVIQDINTELQVFNFCLTKQFSDTLYICAVISIAFYYYNRQKVHFLNVIKSIRENKSKSIERFLPWVILVKNDDGKVATNLVNEFAQVLTQLFAVKAREMIEKEIGTEIAKLNRWTIIKELDEEVYNATDEWLMRYILAPQDLIVERFEGKWAVIKAATDEKLIQLINTVRMTFSELFHLIDAVNNVCQEQGAHVLSFVDDLFKPKDDEANHQPSGKKLSMAKLFYRYLVDVEVPGEISTSNGSIYTVDPRWRTIQDRFPRTNEEIKRMFLSLENRFETSTISYPGLFLDMIISLQHEAEQTISSHMASLIQEIGMNAHEHLVKQIRGCEAQCPCCKRICDVDHHLDVISPIGQGENRHRCQLGHQLRGMGGIRYETTNEASTAWCEIINDNDPVTNRNNIRQKWSAFKNTNTSWDFGDPKTRENVAAPYVYIWTRVGKHLCDHFGNGMIFVEKNSPTLVPHFIFILDHSGSMNEKSNASTGRRTQSAAAQSNVSATGADQSQLTPWEHLLQAVKGFIDLRKRQVSLNDRVTMIVFGNRAERIYNREKLIEINLERLKIPTKLCGEGTNYSAAFQMVISTLAEVNSNPERNDLQHTIVFMTDGEPQGYPTKELQTLRDLRAGA